jgi:hypothetical protein
VQYVVFYVHHEQPQPVECELTFVSYHLVAASLAKAFLSATIYFYHQLSETFNKRPSHFVSRSWFDSLSQPKVDIPLVEVENDDYREALARGSATVSL